MIKSWKDGEIMLDKHYIDKDVAESDLIGGKYKLIVSYIYKQLMN